MVNPRRAAEAAAAKKDARREVAIQSTTAVSGAAGGVNLGQGMKAGLGELVEPSKFIKVGEHQLGPGNLHEGTWVSTLKKTNELAQNIAGEHASDIASLTLGAAGIVAGVYLGKKIHSALGKQWRR